jgi:hypothetical protein
MRKPPDYFTGFPLRQLWSEFVGDCGDDGLKPNSDFVGRKKYDRPELAAVPVASSNCGSQRTMTPSNTVPTTAADELRSVTTTPGRTVLVNAARSCGDGAVAIIIVV